MAEAPPRMRYGRPGGTTNEGQPASASGDDEHNDFSIESDEDRQLAQIEEWLIMTERRLERLDAKIDRLGGAIDQLNTQLAAVLTEMPTRKGINLYLVGGLIGGLAVGLAIMGITIGGFVGGLSSLKSGPQTAAPAATPYQPQAPIIIQMPSGMMMPGLPSPQVSTAPPPTLPSPPVK